MSTTDPNLSVSTAAQRARGTFGWVTPLLTSILLLMIAAGGFWMAFAAGLFGMYVQNPTAVEPEFLQVLSIPLGMMLSIVGGIFWVVLTTVAAVKGKQRTLFLFGPGVWFVCAAVGFAVGAVASPAYLDSNESLRMLVSAILGAIGVVIVVAAFTIMNRHGKTVARREKAVDEVMTNGTLTTATVSDQGYVSLPVEAVNHLVAVTFTFYDSQGVQRWVKKSLVLHVGNPIKNGDRTRLWYDAKHPGNTDRIVIEAVLNSPVKTFAGVRYSVRPRTAADPLNFE